MNWIIDRIEDNTAVCEAEDCFVDIPLSALPDGVKEGDVIALTIDNAQTADSRRKINDIMNKLFKD